MKENKKDPSGGGGGGGGRGGGKRGSQDPILTAYKSGYIFIFLHRFIDPSWIRSHLWDPSGRSLAVWNCWSFVYLGDIKSGNESTWQHWKYGAHLLGLLLWDPAGFFPVVVKILVRILFSAIVFFSTFFFKVFNRFFAFLIDSFWILQDWAGFWGFQRVWGIFRIFWGSLWDF